MANMVAIEELARMKKKIKYYDVVQIDEAISAKAVEFIETYKLSHGLSTPDAIIGATTVSLALIRNTYCFIYSEHVSL
ncbi:MAG: hypothetical protein IPK21_18445 [Haliscomenobacter sp.]|nr:hypothetical protein [Haliscomenobacter sp.]